jgi:hypothetical protein
MTILWELQVVFGGLEAPMPVPAKGLGFRVWSWGLEFGVFGVEV